MTAESLADLLQRRLVDLVAELRRRDDEVRRGVPDSVHQARVTCRRLRSLLVTCQAHLDCEVTEPVRVELRWLAHALGEARDAEVVRDRLLDLLDQEPRQSGTESVRRRVDRTYAARMDAAMGAAEEALESPRYAALLAALDALLARPPWTDDAATADADDVLWRRVRKEGKRLRRRVRAATTIGDLEDAAPSDLAWHEARKAAKRLRYACETAAPVLGARAEQAREAAQQVTKALGERQDTVVTRAHLLLLAEAAGEAGESTFTYGRLHAREEARAAELDREVARRWRRLQ